jgi:cytochrome P450
MLGIEVSPEQEAEAYADIAALGESLMGGVRFSAQRLSDARVAELRVPFERLVAYARTAYDQPHARAGSIVRRLRDLELTFEDVKGVLGTMFLVGTHTTSIALPRMLAVLLDTGQWRLLRRQPELLLGAIDETLRCTVPVPATIRSVARETRIDGHRFPAGSRVFVFTYNLARSPALFSDPARCDITRPIDSPGRHLWYGGGPHFCLGFALAQRELRAVLETLLSVPGELRVARRRYARQVLLPAYARHEVQVSAS